MKKKLKAMKRRWRKLHQMDRRFFRLIGAFSILYLLLLPLSLAFLPCLAWMMTLILLQCFNIGTRRNRQYVYYLKGMIRQEQIDWFANIKTRFDNAELSARLKQLHSGYKKLEYDYNQLKKNINSKKKKK